MLNPGQDRSDYGLQLRPPIGFVLDAAIATTYSLNLDTLLLLPIAMCFSDTLEGNLQGEKIAILEAMSQLQGRFAVFHQTGKIHIPPTFNRLFTLLEPFLASITPRADGSNDAFTSFHPKLWLLRFRNKDLPKVLQYRLIVLSRNITFDRQWDIAASIDGISGTERVNDNDMLYEFIRSLAHHASKLNRDLVEQLAIEVHNVVWAPPKPFNSIRMLPGGGAHLKKGGEKFGAPVDFGRTIDELIVVSPFIDEKAIDAFNNLMVGAAAKRYLFSRSASLDNLGKELLNSWECYSVNESIVNGEERRELPDAEVQDLHAKLFISRSGQTVHWHVGSANATNAALGSLEGGSPRNSEFMLRLSTSSPDAFPDALKKEWLANPLGNLFTPHCFEKYEATEAESYARALRLLSYKLISAKWYLRAELDDGDRFSLRLSVEPLIFIPEGFKVNVGLLCIPGRYDEMAQVAEQTMIWRGLALTQISSFVPLRIIGPVPEVTESLVIQASLELPKNIDRSAGILRELIDTPEKLINYVRLLLHPESSKELWDSAEHKKGDGADDLFGFDLTSGLMEQLLGAASRRPEQLARVRELINRLRRIGTPVPEEFQTLWNHFSAYAKEAP